jgi:TrmH family RNA methyltransferase
MFQLSNSKKKLIRSLSMKKFRQAEGLFLVEGDKLVREVITHHRGSAGSRFRINAVIATDPWMDSHPYLEDLDFEVYRATSSELEQVSGQKTPNQVMAIVHQYEPELEPYLLRTELSIGLETLQDPGNMGTIIRLADWFGIEHIICSEDCVELYNPKTIQSTMGSFLRVNIYYADLAAQLDHLRMEEKYMIYGTGQNGSNLFHTPLFLPGIILFGNEANGLSGGIMELADRILTIPYHNRSSHPESLNVATAAAILCAEFRRGHSK